MQANIVGDGGLVERSLGTQQATDECLALYAFPSGKVRHKLQECCEIDHLLLLCHFAKLQIAISRREFLGVYLVVFKHFREDLGRHCRRRGLAGSGAIPLESSLQLFRHSQKYRYTAASHPTASFSLPDVVAPSAPPMVLITT